MRPPGWSRLGRCSCFYWAGCYWALGLILLAGPAGAAEPDPLAAIKPGEWYEVPDSRLDAVAPSEKDFPWLSGNVAGVVDCWAGGAFDTQRDRLYIGPGGGHAGYNGNEVYAFDLHDLNWRRLTDPDPVIPGTEYTDLNQSPFAMHTYDGVEYLPPPIDRYVVIGGWGTPRTYALDPDHPRHWEVYADHETGRTGDYCAYDPVTQLLWLNTPSTAGKLSQWDPLAHRWTLRLSTTPEPSYYETADIDFRRQLLVACGRGKLKVTKLAAIPAAVTCEIASTSGDGQVVAQAPSPGFCYAPLLDRFVAWANGPDVYTLDVEALRWTKHPPAATNRVVPTPAQQWGTFGRFRYVPARNLFILYNGVKENVYLYRLTADKPNPIVAVRATPLRSTLELSIPAPAVSVEAVYADGSHKDVTAEASYFSLDPAVAETNVRGKGTVTGVGIGQARIRAVYSDPAYKRGYGDEAALNVKPVEPAPTLDAVHCDADELTIVAGDEFRIRATGSYSRGSDRFTRPAGDDVQWSCEPASVATVDHGVVRALRPGSAVVRAKLADRSAAIPVTIAPAPQIKRIVFQVKESPVRPGWQAETGNAFTAERGFGWLDNRDITQRDDRASAHHELLKGFNAVAKKQFKLAVPPGGYAVRIAMGDADYGNPPFEVWTALGEEKLLYHQGRKNTVETRRVVAGADGLVLTINGPINYLIAVPLGIDLDKYADDGP